MKVVDLSRQIASDMTVYPGDPEVEITPYHTYAENGWNLSRITMGSHTGTHVDAFAHMHPGKASVDEIPIERFFGEAQVVDDEKTWPNGIGLFFLEKIEISSLDKILKTQPSFVGGELTEELERALLAKEIITYTDLVNLDQIPINTSFTFYGLPLNIKKGDGSPVRAIAVLEE